MNLDSHSNNEFVQDSWQTSLVQYVADNIDHNSQTLTGHGTFHAMGIIAVWSSSKQLSTNVIPRYKTRLSSEELKNKGIELKPYYKSIKQVADDIQILPDVQITPAMMHTFKCNDLLWHCSSLFSQRSNCRPNWSGYMQVATNKTTLKGNRIPSDY